MGNRLSPCLFKVCILSLGISLYCQALSYTSLSLGMRPSESKGGSLEGPLQ